jgi:hypothetical protein
VATESLRQIRSTSTASVQLTLEDTCARILLHGQVDEHSLLHLHELADNIADDGRLHQVRLRLTGTAFGPAGISRLRASLESLEARLRRCGAELVVSAADPLPPTALPPSLRTG